MPAQDFAEQSDHNTASGCVPGPHVTSRAVSGGVWAVDVVVCMAYNHMLVYIYANTYA